MTTLGIHMLGRIRIGELASIVTPGTNAMPAISLHIEYECPCMEVVSNAAQASLLKHIRAYRAACISNTAAAGETVLAMASSIPIIYPCLNFAWLWALTGFAGNAFLGGFVGLEGVFFETSYKIFYESKDPIRTTFSPIRIH